MSPGGLEPAPGGLEPDVQAVLDAMNALPAPPADAVPISEARAAHDAESARLGGPGPPVAAVRDALFPGPGGEVPVRLYTPAGAQAPLPLVAYLHGGGWLLGTLDSFDTVCRALANAAGALVASVGYRLAPEHPFPAGLDDCLAVTRRLRATGAELGGDPERLALVGDSAGGNLAAVLARRLRDAGDPPPRLQALIYPVTDARLNRPSALAFATGYGLTLEGMHRFWGLYLDGHEPGDPDASPLRADDLAGLPPAFVLTAGHDILRDEGEAYARALEAAGVPVALRRYDGAIHGFWRWQATVAAAPRAVADVAAALRAAFGTT